MMANIFCIIFLLQIICNYLRNVVYAFSTPVITYMGLQLKRSTILIGSTQGGTRIYIKGQFFAENPSNNQVFVGPNPCQILEGYSTTSSIVCQTTPPRTINTTDLQVFVVVNGVIIHCPSTIRCKFSYQTSSTPKIFGVLPRSSFPGQRLYVVGIHKNTFYGGQLKFQGIETVLKIGESQCSLNGIEQSINPSLLQPFECNSDPMQLTGQYRFSQRLKTGYARQTHSILIQTSFFTGENYQHRVIPKVNLSYHTGGIHGHRLVLNGSGLVKDINSYQCFVAGQICSIISAKNDELVVEIPQFDSVNNVNFGKLNQDLLDNFTQQHPYIGGQGFNYTRMSRDQSYQNLQDWVIYARSRQASIISEQKIISDLATSLYQNSQTSYVEYIRGYFYTAVNGTYKFGATCKNYLIVKISSIQNSSNSDYMQTILSINETSQNYINVYANNYDIAINYVNLTVGYHFMEIVTVCEAGGGFYKISVVMPAWTSNLVANLVRQNEQFSIYPEAIQSQLITMEVYGLTGYFLLQKLILGNLKVVNITFGDQNATVFSKLKSYWKYQMIGVTTQYMDMSGNVTTDINLIEGYRYTIQFLNYRIDTGFPTVNLDNLTSSPNIEKSCQFKTIRNHSAPLSGSFQLIIDGIPLIVNNVTQISYVESQQILGQALSKHFNGSDIIVFRKANTRVHDKISFVIQYGGLVNPPTSVILNVTGMSGGLTNVVLWTRIIPQSFNFDNYQYFSVPYQFLKQHSDFPSLEIKINKIPAICYNCSYTFNQSITVQLVNASLNLQTLSFTLLNYSSLAINTSQIMVSFMGAQCIDVSQVTALSYTCTFSKNTDGSVAIPAALAQPPIVHIQNSGYCNYSGNALLTIPLIVSSISPSASGSGGGIEAIITGSGFPLQFQSSLQIKICGNNVTNFIKVTNQQIIFEIPPQIILGASNSQITVNGVTTSFNFVYNSALNPNVTAVSPISASPAIFNLQLTISGNGFGSILDTEAYLYQNGIQKYQLDLLFVNNTSITGVFNGGNIGQYQIVVKTSNGISSTTTNVIFSSATTITNVLPSNGPFGGGYNITIYGSGFGPTINSNKVLIISELCQILQINQTQITCKVPRINDTFPPQTPLNISIYSFKNNQDKSECIGNCSFIYTLINTPIILLPTITKYKYKDNVTIVSSNSTNLTSAQVVVNGVNVPITSVDDHQLIFQFPDLPYGSYQFFIQLGSSYAYPALILQTISTIIVYNFQGSNQGKILRYQGSAMNADSSDPKWNFYTQCPEKMTLSFLTLTFSEFYFEMPPMPQTQTSCKNTLIYGSTSNTFKYIYKYELTPQIIITNLPNGTYVMQRTKLQAQIIQFITFTQINQLGKQANSVFYFNFIPINETNSFLQPRDTTILPAGIFIIKIHSKTYGYSKITPKYITKTFTTTPYISGSIISGFMGGKKLFINSNQFISINPENNDIRVCGIKSQISSSNSSGIQIRVPPLLTSITQQFYQISVQEEILLGNIISDTTDKMQFAFDGNSQTSYISIAENCYIGYGFGNDRIAHITAIRYMPALSFDNPHDNFMNSLIEGSLDNITWTNIIDITYEQIKKDWNYWRVKENQVLQFRYIRFKGNQNNTCMIAEFQVYGYFYSTANVVPSSSYTCALTIHNLPSQIITIPNAVIYSHSAYSQITSMSPLFGPTLGGTTLHLTGTNLGGSITIIIDGFSCNVSSNNNTNIICVTTAKTHAVKKHSFVVTSNDNYAKIAITPFVYADRWSQAATWGSQQLAPLKNSSVTIPKQKAILYDVPNFELYNLTIKGQLYFSDQQNMNITSHFIFVKGGIFQAGTQKTPYQNVLNINLLGKPSDFLMESYKNKVFVCQNCELRLHGKSRNTLWTELTTTANVNNTVINLQKPVDWQNGEKIVIASTEFDGNQTQQLSVSSVDNTGTILTLSSQLKYKHFAGSESVGTQVFQMRAQVGLLSRNIRILNGNTQISQLQYGPHIIIKGQQKKGLKIELQNVEIEGCGKKIQNPEVCLLFFYNKQIPESYIKGLSIHNGNVRGITLKGTHHLLVENNIIYNVKSHGFILQDAVQRSNIIQDNLIINTNQSYNDLMNGVRVSSFWISNPYNIFRRNHAVGSQFQGILYQFSQNPQGASASQYICPNGQKILISENNVAHSNRQYGFRIYTLSARRDACKPTFNESLLDPFSSNPSIQSIISGYRIWKNNNIGFFGQILGNTKITNMKAADNLIANIQIDKTNLTKQLVVVQNCIIFGYSSNAPVTVPNENDIAYGLVASRTDGMLVKDTFFVNFMANMVPIRSCSRCESSRYFVSGSVTTQFSNISYININGKYLYWAGLRRQIFIDLDGTLTAPIQALVPSITVKQTKGTITPNRPSSLVPNHCFAIGGSTWNNSIYCDETISMRSIIFCYVVPSFTDNLNAVLLTNPIENASLISYTRIGSEQFSMYSMDIGSSWSYPFAVNQYYRISWQNELDFSHLKIAPSGLWLDTQAVILRFDYKQYKDAYEVIKIFKKNIQKPYLIETQTELNISSCYNGQFNIDLNAQSLFICISGRNKTIREWIDLIAIPCQNYCPQFEISGRQNFPRYWSNTTQWPNEALPTVGNNVTIPYQWNMILDIDPPVLNFVDIKGQLIFDKGRDNIFQAHYIWVSSGKLIIGDDISPFKRKAQIILHGNESSALMEINTQHGNKILAITGSLQTNGNIGQNIWTRLTQIAKVGDVGIKVESTYGWTVGDTIVIGPSYAGNTQYQERNITEINHDYFVINFTQPLLYQHFGNYKVTLSRDGNVLDARSAVGIVSRNIKIRKADDNNAWGCHILNCISTQNQQIEGHIVFKGVQIKNCGQHDTTYAGIKIKNFPSNNSASKMITIEDSSIHDCLSYCLYSSNSSNIKIYNNLIFKGYRSLAFAQNVKDYKFTKNLLIGARKRLPQINYDFSSIMSDDISGYTHYYPTTELNNVEVSFNLVQGSQGEGFIFPLFPCEKIAIFPFFQNTAGSCYIGFALNKIDGFSCLSAQSLISYANKIAVISNPMGQLTKLQYRNLLLADNQIGISLNFAHDTDNNTFYLENSYIFGLSRPQCSSCYLPSTISFCNSSTGVQIGTVTQTGVNFPLDVSILRMNYISSQAAFDFKTYLDNVVFSNFLYNYSSPLPYCQKMAVFRSNPTELDAVGSVYLQNTKCWNCQDGTYASFNTNNSNNSQCGPIACTGPQNYFIYDRDGLFTGKVSQMVPNGNIFSQIPFNECTLNPAMNGYYCEEAKYAILQFESISIDFKDRSIQPVQLSYSDFNFTLIINSWKSWQSHDNYRYMRFWSLLALFNKYKLSYSSSPPSDSRFQIQKRMLPNGNAQDYIIISTQYTQSSIQILVKNDSGTDIVQKSQITNNFTDVDLYNYSSICGANTFNPNTGLLQFVVNGNNNCQVRVRSSNFIRFNFLIDQIYSDYILHDSIGNFTFNLSIFLDIPETRIVIYRVYEGSTTLQVAINTLPVPLQQTKIQPVDINAQQSELQSLAQKVRLGVQDKSLQLGGPILYFHAQVIIKGLSGQILSQNSPTTNKNLRLILGFGIGIPLVVILVATTVYCGFKGHDVFERKDQQNNQIQQSSVFTIKEQDQKSNHDANSGFFMYQLKDQMLHNN